MGSSDAPILLTTARLHMALLPPGAAERVLAYHEANREHLGAVAPERPTGFFNLAWWRVQLARDAEEQRAGQSLRLLLLPRDVPLAVAPVIGNAHLTDIRLGPFQACELGFGLDHRYQGQGLMSEALSALCAHALGPMGLHRIQARHLPDNRRSAAVLRRLGFVTEGRARESVLIDGAWRDLILTALLASPRPSGRRKLRARTGKGVA